MSTFGWVMLSLFPIHIFWGVGYVAPWPDFSSGWDPIHLFPIIFLLPQVFGQSLVLFFSLFEASSALSLSNMLRLRQITKRGEGGEQKGTINQCVPSSFSEESPSLAVYNTPDQSNSAPRQMRHFPHSLFKEQGHNSQNGDGKLLVKNVHGNIVMLGKFYTRPLFLFKSKPLRTLHRTFLRTLLFFKKAGKNIKKPTIFWHFSHRPSATLCPTAPGPPGGQTWWLGLHGSSRSPCAFPRYEENLIWPKN